jgi:hypothetical protein
MLPPRGSLLRSVIDRHPVNGWQGEYDIDLFEHVLSLELRLLQLSKETSRNALKSKKSKTADAGLMRRVKLTTLLRRLVARLQRSLHF